MIIVCGNTKKGGVGKSTIATNLAVDLARMGKHVKILDVDPENSASMDFINQRKKGDINCHIIDNTVDLINDLKEYKEDFVIVDIGGLESDLTATAIAVADLIFVPFRLSSKDLKALGSFITWLQDLFDDEAATPDIYLTPNFVHPNSNKNKIRKDLDVLVQQGFKIGSILTNRQSYIDSADEGLSVTEYGDTNAAAEIYDLKQIVLGT